MSDLYSDMSSKVKWRGELSDKFSIRQGVTRGNYVPRLLQNVCQSSPG